LDLNNYYQILGVPETASMKLIKDQYRLLAKRYHPDKNDGDKDAETKFKLIGEAYHHLSDVYRRSVYDRKLRYKTYVELEVKAKPYYYEPPTKTPEEIKKDKHFEYLSFSLFVGCCFLIITLIIGFIDNKGYKFQIPDKVFYLPNEYFEGYIPDELEYDKILLYKEDDRNGEVRFVNSEDKVLYIMSQREFCKIYPFCK